MNCVGQWIISFVKLFRCPACAIKDRVLSIVCCTRSDSPSRSADAQMIANNRKEHTSLYLYTGECSTSRRTTMRIIFSWKQISLASVRNSSIHTSRRNLHTLKLIMTVNYCSRAHRKLCRLSMTAQHKAFYANSIRLDDTKRLCTALVTVHCWGYLNSVTMSCDHEPSDKYVCLPPQPERIPQERSAARNMFLPHLARFKSRTVSS